jgi:hypothetical protein
MSIATMSLLPSPSLSKSVGTKTRSRIEFA